MMQRSNVVVDLQNERYGTSPSSRSTSLRLDVGRPDYVAPFLGFRGDVPSKIRRRAGKRRAAEIGNPCLHPWLRECCVDLPVELVDDLNGRVLWDAHTVPRACLIAWHKFTHGRDVRQRLRTRRGGDRERAQLAGFDILDG